jgi:hypothetical protein
MRVSSMPQREPTTTEAKKVAERTEFDHLVNSKARSICRQCDIYLVSYGRELVNKMIPTMEKGETSSRHQNFETNGTFLQ